MRVTKIVESLAAIDQPESLEHWSNPAQLEVIVHHADVVWFEIVVVRTAMALADVVAQFVNERSYLMVSCADLPGEST